MKSIILFLSLSLWIPVSSRACTAFCLFMQERVLLAKNLDWPIDDGLILLNRSGVSKSSFAPCGSAVNWTSKYNNISFNQFGKEFPLGGMNEMGLVVEELNMPPVKLLPDCGKKVLNEFQVVQYVLDNFATVSEVERTLSSFRLEPLFLSLHYLLMDREGCACIMEFDGKAFVFYHPDEAHKAVLSNNPYKESLRYLKHFRGFGGDQEVRHRSGSNERFVSVAHILMQGAIDEPVNHCFNILDTISQPDTRWSLVYDPCSLCIHLKFHSCTCRQEISLKEVMQRSDPAGLGAEIGWCKRDDRLRLKAVTRQENQDLIESVLQELGGELDLKHRSFLSPAMVTYSNAYIIE